MLDILKDYAPLMQFLAWVAVPVGATITGWYHIKKTISDHGEKIRIQDEQIKTKQSLEIAKLKEENFEKKIKEIEDRQSREVDGIKREMGELKKEIHELPQRFSVQLAQAEKRIIDQLHFVMGSFKK